MSLHARELLCTHFVVVVGLLIVMGDIVLGGGLAVEKGRYPFSSFAFFNSPIGPGHARYFIAYGDAHTLAATTDSSHNILISKLETRVGLELESGTVATSTRARIRAYIPPEENMVWVYKEVVDSNTLITQRRRHGEGAVLIGKLEL